MEWQYVDIFCSLVLFKVMTTNDDILLKIRIKTNLFFEQALSSSQVGDICWSFKQHKPFLWAGSLIQSSQ